MGDMGVSSEIRIKEEYINVSEVRRRNVKCFQMVADRHVRSKAMLCFVGVFFSRASAAAAAPKKVDAGVSNPSRAPEADMTGLCLVRGDAQPCF
jgi:hypothetical protein